MRGNSLEDDVSSEELEAALKNCAAEVEPAEVTASPIDVVVEASAVVVEEE